MPTYGIVLNVAGPGTGPVAPKPLHAYGRTDAIHRYVADRLSGAVDSVVNTWKDEIGTADYTTGTGTQTLTIKTEAGGFKSVAQPQAAMSGAQVQRLQRTGDPNVRTIVQVFRNPLASAGGSRNLWLSMRQWRTFVGASNGQPGVATVSGSGGSGIVARAVGDVGTGIEIMSATVADNGAAGLSMLGDAGATGTLTFGAATTLDTMFSGDTTALDSRMLEQIEFGTVLTVSERQTVMAALASHYGV